MKFLEFQNDVVSKLLFVALLVCVLLFATIGIVQFLKNKNGIYLFKTEYLAFIVNVVLYVIAYALAIYVLKYKFVWYELVAVILVGICTGAYASLVAEKLFRQKK